MRTIFKQKLITPHNYPRIAMRIVPQDQRDAIRPGIIISHYAFTTRQGQDGYVIISHTTRRAGLCIADGCTAWGTWSEETDTITTDGGQLYNRRGERVFAIGSQAAGYSAAAG
jgi:hypothetical protein